MKNFAAILFILMFFSSAQISIAEEEVALDLPNFSKINSNIKKSTKKHFENTKVRFKSAKKTIQKKGGELKDKSAQKFNEAKEGVNTAILKTGNPTDQNLNNMTKKERKNALSKYQSQGYYGTLPNIEREFDYLKQNNKKTSLDGKYKDTLIDEMNLQKSPVQDDLFLDVILKKEKNTKYTQDVLRFIPIFERFKTCISESCNIQKFNANVNVIDLYTRRLEKDYEYSPESSSESYYLIRNIAYLSKLQGNLKYEANFYSKYMPLQGSIYSKENIQKKDMELILELDKTIFALRQLQ